MSQFTRIFTESLRFLSGQPQQQQAIQTRPKEQQQNFDYFLILDFEVSILK